MPVRGFNVMGVSAGILPFESEHVAYHHLYLLGVTVLAMSTDSRFTHKVWQEEDAS